MPTSPGTPQYGLRGRNVECDVLDRLLRDLRAGRHQVLVLRGEPGVGKSALLEYTLRRSSGFRVLRATGVEYEIELAYAGLHQLCAPLLPLRDRLPEPQRAALEAAFGLGLQAPADRFLVGLAVLGLISEAAEEQPVLCVVDDAQWLDRESVQTIAFIARRLLAEPVGMVIAVRPSQGQELVGLAELPVDGLDATDARALLDAAWPGRLDEQVRDRVIAESGGIPLALLELPRGLSPAELAGGFELPGGAPLTTQIEQSFVRQFESLPDDARLLLLAAAAEPLGDVGLLLRAAELLELDEQAAVVVQAAGLVELGAHVRFRHPLVRSGVYRAASVVDRLKVHRALADATDAERDPDRRAWHRGHATYGLDESVAAELERSAGRAEARGGIAAAAQFLERAAELTPDPARRGRRALAAARARNESGALEAAHRLLAAAEACPQDDLGRAQLARLRAQLVFVRNRGIDAPPLLIEAADKLAPYDADAARECYLEALGATIYAGRLHRGIGSLEVATAARKAPGGQEPLRPTDLLLEGLAIRVTDGYDAGIAPLRRALEAFGPDSGVQDHEFLRWCYLSWIAAADLWDEVRMEELATRAVRLCRRSGALATLPLALGYEAVVRVHAGEFASAAVLLDESDAIVKATGSPAVRYPLYLLSAWRGVAPDVLREMYDHDLEGLADRGEGRGLYGGAGYANAASYNGLGQYDAALAAARSACEYDDLGVYGFTLIELVEAAVRSGVRDEAEDALRRLEERTSAAGTEWALGVQARSRALLSDGDAAEESYREALTQLGRTRVTVQLARAHLVYGEWLRRSNRRVDARQQLRTAYELFVGIGAQSYAERARRELAAVGDIARGRGEVSLGVLTRQESQIARLAREGLTNPAIGAELYLSRHTVEWHLRKVFTKLGINSRKQLVDLPVNRLNSA
ncbi:AAA family ATPase [Kribbella sp. NPDC051770]|uniref:ATP-binding protein n=1 Tax=Kribbella sp. NPDC051770 TaxID=3155413 RepID=UPI0034480DF9